MAVLHQQQQQQDETYKTSYQPPYPLGQMESVQVGDIVAIDVVDGTVLVHFQQFTVDDVNQLAIMTDIAVFARCERQVLCYEVRQVQVLDMVLRLITETDDCIVLTCREVLQGFGKVTHHMKHGTCLCQRVSDGATGHIGYLLALDLAHVELVSILMVAAIDYLIVKLKDGTGVVDKRLPIG